MDGPHSRETSLFQVGETIKIEGRVGGDEEPKNRQGTGEKSAFVADGYE